MCKLLTKIFLNGLQQVIVGKVIEQDIIFSVVQENWFIWLLLISYLLSIVADMVKTMIPVPKDVTDWG